MPQIAAQLAAASYSHFMAWYWLVWFILSIPVAFLIPELIMLAKHRPEDTLSAQVWRLEQFLPGQQLWQWTALHFLLGGIIALMFVWLIGHFLWGLWA